ncbi:170 kDa surface lectin precursor, putative [Entamoeba invadens IP1]|uniref:170 kDa surface lectin, putative n=1 Tax=Entamoeba invadens IP1 TaxID=370355 RepID=A0A0A1U7M6_ENTIV|nr:170 kDa surface lectin precursor, putative [Entamoeba invadens IP1]ELP90878.1 170 kDa surface lectin precursor, putative [Entamoeba invadens IP1]|eukprot:XP_004257649.1 170 kDa surface lectin precursor, putative [Entamoeba invadens IP1]
MRSIIIIILCAIALADILNEFSGDVDIYDMGRIGRGKNAGMWQHSYDNGYDIYYYLAMQPWRHFVWTYNDNGVWVTKTMNEDNNVADYTKLDTNTEQDFCQKDYGYPIMKFEIDWDRVPTDDTRLTQVDVNGKTCYQYAAKSPLVYVVLSAKRDDVKKDNYDICRMDFIGGKSVTFRSFNGLNAQFVSDYYTNMTAKCVKQFTANNVNSELALVFGISDKAALKNVQNAFGNYKNLATITDVTVYYLTGEAYSIAKTTLSNLNYDFLSSFEPVKGKVDSLIIAAQRDLADKVSKKSIKRGTILVLTDEGISREFTASTDFDKKNLTVHVVSLNTQGSAMTAKLTTLLSLGDHFHETSDKTQIEAVINDAFVGIRANLTERCDRTKCNGFCDAKNRCTCPMCCENTCYYSYCDTTTASCTPWPPANPKQKIVCPSTCVGDYTCNDMEGCVVSRYNTSCQPPVSCMSTTCPNNQVRDTCKLVDNCQQDDTPAADGYCWTYKCDAISGYCIKNTRGTNKCPLKTSNCQQYKCSADLTCTVETKVCVKTMPYIEMDCYIAKCNEKTGQCENKLSCDVYSSCGGDTSGESICYCNATTNNICKCDTKPNGVYCNDNTQICDYTGDTPKCVNSICKEDLTIKDCMVSSCNETTGQLIWNPITCTGTVPADTNCANMYVYGCTNNVCTVVQKVTDSELNVNCGICKWDATQNKVVFTTTCTSLQSSCGGFNGVCSANGMMCMYPNQVNGVTQDPQTFCQVCLPLTCGGDSTVYKYTYDTTTGKCSYAMNKVPQCSVCETSTGLYTSVCDNIKLEKTWTSKSGANITYKIPKDCRNNQCIPRYPVTCLEEELFEDVFAQFGVCMDYLKASYHYSSKLDTYNFVYGFAQSDEFMAEADAEAYCEWSFVESNCKRCLITPSGGEEEAKFEVYDDCPRDNGGVQYICTSNECKVDPDFKCQPENCIVKALVILENGSNTCEDAYSLCTQQNTKVESIRKSVYDNYDNVGRSMKCDSTTCVSNKCPTSANSNCDQFEENHDYGCRLPTYECDIENGYYCKFKTINMTNPSQDNIYFTTRDGVHFNNKCFEYKCVETCTGGSSTYEGSILDTATQMTCTHKWVVTKDVSKPASRNLCEEATCDTTTGLPVYTDKSCIVSEEFPTLTSNQARCFYCQCSYVDGTASLVMFADTETEHYQLDACGNCMVMNQTDRTQQLNNKVECILAGEINNTGAIAAATTVAAVVVALIVALIAVSIGLFKTYQLVSSAMKNVVNVANENTQFKAAENVAANTNFNE